MRLIGINQIWVYTGHYSLWFLVLGQGLYKSKKSLTKEVLSNCMTPCLFLCPLFCFLTSWSLFSNNTTRVFGMTDELDVYTQVFVLCPHVMQVVEKLAEGMKSQITNVICLDFTSTTEEQIHSESSITKGSASKG